MKPRNAIVALIFIGILGGVIFAYLYYTQQLTYRMARQNFEAQKNIQAQQEAEDLAAKEERKTEIIKSLTKTATSSEKTEEERKADEQRKKEILQALLKK